jgi:hypothetical protein
VRRCFLESVDQSDLTVSRAVFAEEVRRRQKLRSSHPEVLARPAPVERALLKVEVPVIRCSCDGG